MSREAAIITKFDSFAKVLTLADEIIEEIAKGNRDRYLILYELLIIIDRVTCADKKLESSKLTWEYSIQRKFGSLEKTGDFIFLACLRNKVNKDLSLLRLYGENNNSKEIEKEIEADLFQRNDFRKDFSKAQKLVDAKTFHASNERAFYTQRLDDFNAKAKPALKNVVVPYCPDENSKETWYGDILSKAEAGSPIAFLELNVTAEESILPWIGTAFVFVLSKETIHAELTKDNMLAVRIQTIGKNEHAISYDIIKLFPNYKDASKNSFFYNTIIPKIFKRYLGQIKQRKTASAQEILAQLLYTEDKLVRLKQIINAIGWKAFVLLPMDISNDLMTLYQEIIKPIFITYYKQSIATNALPNETSETNLNTEFFCFPINEEGFFGAAIQSIENTKQSIPSSSQSPVTFFPWVNPEYKSDSDNEGKAREAVKFLASSSKP